MRVERAVIVPCNEMPDIEACVRLWKHSFHSTANLATVVCNDHLWRCDTQSIMAAFQAFQKLCDLGVCARLTESLDRNNYLVQQIGKFSIVQDSPSLLSRFPH